MTEHTLSGVAEDTYVYCPEADETFGPGGESVDFEYCFYCGEAAHNERHRVDEEISEIFCDNTIMSTYRYCPHCGSQEGAIR